MKPLYSLVILVFALCPSYGQKSETPVIDSSKYIPQPTGWTNDFAGLFSKEETASLDSLVGDYERKTGVEIAVATIDSSMMGPIGFEPYTLLMMNTWGVGKKGKNNGILIAIFPDIRKVRIQNGYGIEKVLSDQETKEIIDTVMVPLFKEGKYYKGAWEGILALMNKLEQKGDY